MIHYKHKQLFKVQLLYKIKLKNPDDNAKHPLICQTALGIALDG
jgi:hypothetical protein